MQDTTQAKAKDKETAIGCDIEIPPWSFTVPRLQGGTELICIARDSDCPYLPIPPNVHAVSKYLFWCFYSLHRQSFMNYFLYCFRSARRVLPRYFVKLAGITARLWT